MIGLTVEDIQNKLCEVSSLSKEDKDIITNLIIENNKAIETKIGEIATAKVSERFKSLSERIRRGF